MLIGSIRVKNFYGGSQMMWKDGFWIEMAELIATQSYCKKAQVGAVIVKNREFISMGTNGTAPGDDNCCEDQDNNTEHWRVNHAEMNALSRANGKAKGATMYVTLAPCYECAKNMILFGIERLVYGKVKEEYEDVLIYLESMGIETEEAI
jgi:dCMP deaminase